MSEKPVIFISHSSHDSELARYLKQQIEVCVDNAEVFASDIDPGENWFDKVMQKLKQADAIVVLITPNSVNLSHWVWFELGYFWARHDAQVDNLDQRRKVYYPLFIDGVELPNPVYDLQIQAASLSDNKGMISFFRNLSAKFNGDLSRLDTRDIASLASVYRENVKTRDDAINAPTLPSPYLDYPDEALEEKLREDYFLANLKDLLWDIVNTTKQNRFSGVKRMSEEIRNRIAGGITSDSGIELLSRMHQNRAFKEYYPYYFQSGNSIFTKALIHYLDLDDGLRLPRGTSKRFLKEIAPEFHLRPIEEQDFEVCTRFEFLPLPLDDLNNQRTDERKET